MDYRPLSVKVWGPAACFTRPEFKVERVSYTVMTPSAARGVLEAIFWKPEFRWRVREIHVLRPVSQRPLSPIGLAAEPDPGRYPLRTFSILRNEVNRRAGRDGGLFIEDCRAQRNTLALRDVAYRILADVAVNPAVPEDPAKYRDQFRRRVRDGRCFHRPYLGCREFAASFAPDDPDESPINHTEELGLMLFDMDYLPSGPSPRFFQARLESGVLRVPPELYPEVVA